MDCTQDISIQPLFVIIHDDAESTKSSEEINDKQLYAGRFKFGLWQKDIFFQAPTGYAENWQKACAIVENRNDYSSFRDFIDTVNVTFKEMGFQVIAK